MKLRFAPSPTGTLHIGSARTAIFNWIWAKSLGAQLVLRIEDTDQRRSTQVFEDNIIEALDWLGIDFDEGPMNPKDGILYRQSECIAASIYQPYIDALLRTKNAYYCFETDEELDAERAQADEAGIPFNYSCKSLYYSFV